MKLLFGTAHYRRSGVQGGQLRNRYFEGAPTKSDQTTIRPRPGYSLFSEVSAQPVIAVFHQPGTLDDLIVVVTANFIYSLNAAGTVVGTTPVLNLQSRVSMASGADGVLYLTDGAQLLRLTVAQGETVIAVTAVSLPDLQACSSVAYIAGYFVFTVAGSDVFYFLPPAETVVDPLDFQSAEVGPDDLVGGFVLGDELWLMGKGTAEVLAWTGNATAPFQRQVGRPTDYSLANRDTVQKLDNSLFFVGVDRIVYRTAGLPQRVSDNALEEALAGVDLAQLSSFQFMHEGHWFYCLNAPGLATFAYDVTAGRLTTFDSFGMDTFRCATSCRLSDGRWLLGDSLTGKVYVVGGDDDAGEPIVRIAPALVETPRTRCNVLNLNCSVGTATDPDLNPQILVRHSDDEGLTWSNWRAASLGRAGETKKKVRWWRLGQMSGVRLFEFMDSSAVSVVLRDATVNEDAR